MLERFIDLLHKSELPLPNTNKLVQGWLGLLDEIDERELADVIFDKENVLYETAKSDVENAVFVWVKNLGYEVNT